MRIISGNIRGKKLFTPQNDNIRPTTDKVKESIFNMIAEYIDDAVVIDGFAGSGNLGLEAISRGAKKVYFIENSRDSLDLLKKNILHCNSQEKSEVIFGNFLKVINQIDKKADIVFLDPPYYLNCTVGADIIRPNQIPVGATCGRPNNRYLNLENIIRTILEADILKKDGIIVAEHPSNIKIQETFSVGADIIRPNKIPVRSTCGRPTQSHPNQNKLLKIKSKKYGKITVSIYQFKV